MKFLLVLPLFWVCFKHQTSSFRTYNCYANKCVKEETDREEDAISIRECKARCLNFGGIWPQPTGSFSMANSTSVVDMSAVTFDKHEYPDSISTLLNEAEENFLDRIIEAKEAVDFMSGVMYRVTVRLDVYDPSISYFTTHTDESYKLNVMPAKSERETIKVSIAANTFFGLRHGLETLSQLFFYDELRKVYKMLDEVSIEDKPAFTHRGVALDTARSYISVDNLMKVLDVMGFNKLNTLHWHITDSQSFPYVSKAYPELSKRGAYSDREVYTQDDIKRIVQRARSLGIRVVPEFDVPAHVGEGWNALGEGLVVCFNKEPWRDFCVEPPCGQLDPTNEKVYEILGTLFKELVDLFHSDLFHMGGDEVNLNCWMTDDTIVKWMKEHNFPNTSRSYYELWGKFQQKALKKLKETKRDPHPVAVLWTSHLTSPPYVDDFLNPEEYVIQIWDNKNDSSIRKLLDRKYRVIISNYDELYFDCGGPSWVGESKERWCHPYTGWQFVYGHSPFEIVKSHGLKITEGVKQQVLGSEAALWTEQIDDHTLHTRLWPRAAALAERLWSNPNNSWHDALHRMNHHRERMAKFVPAELLQPKWCYQHDGSCQ